MKLTIHETNATSRWKLALNIRIRIFTFSVSSVIVILLSIIIVKETIFRLGSSDNATNSLFEWYVYEN